MKIGTKALSLTFLLTFTSLQIALAQHNDSIASLKWYEKKSFKVVSAPLALTAIGLPTLLVERHTALSKYSIQSEFMDGPDKFDTRCDDQLRYAPVALVYGLNLVGIKGKNNFIERTVILSKIFLVQHILTTSMKRGFGIERPGGSGHSFPSAHTARAFATATFMHKEYKDISPWYSIAGYSFAVATGALRMVNNHHWLPDVLVGAGVGILSTNLVYLTHQHKWSKWRNKRKSKKQIVVAPSFQAGAPGLYVQLPIQ